MPEPSSAFTAVRHHGRIDADRADGRHVVEPERLDQIAAQRIPRLGAEPLHARRRVVAGERGQVDAGDRLHQPRRLPFLLHRAPRGQRRGAPLDGGEVDARVLDPVGMERRPLVPRPVRAMRDFKVLRPSDAVSRRDRASASPEHAARIRLAAEPGRAILMNAILRLQCHALTSTQARG